MVSVVHINVMASTNLQRMHHLFDYDNTHHFFCILLIEIHIKLQREKLQNKTIFKGYNTN